MEWQEIMAIFNLVESTFGNFYFVLATITCAFVLKGILVGALIHQKKLSKKLFYQKIFFAIAIIGSMAANLAWIVQLAQTLFMPFLSSSIPLFFARLAWCFAPIQYQALSLSIETVVDSDFKLPLHQKILCIFSCIMACAYALLAILVFDQASYFKEFLEMIIPQYNTVFLMIPSVCIALRKLRSSRLPTILRQQGSILLHWFIIPQLVCDVIQTTPLFSYSTYFSSITNSYAFTSLSTLLMTCAMFFCAQKMIGLRFLNFRNHVQSKQKLNFINDFKIVLQRLSHVTTLEELAHICQVFCKDALEVPLTKTELFIRSFSHGTNEHRCSTPSHTQTHAELFLEAHSSMLLPLLKESPIMIYDEIDFTHFYNTDTAHALMLQFLNNINADIFLPIFEHQHLVAYITIERHARLNTLYTNIEHDEMVVFASYLGAIISLLKNKSLELLIEKQQELKQELYGKHTEIEQYKESMRSFVRTNHQQHIGVITYHNRRFTMSNAAAKELISINVNQHEGHPVTQALKQIATAVEAYHTPQTGYTIDKDGNPLVLSALPHLDKNMVIITVSYPNVADIIKQQVDMLRNPSEWDYLLYLETTKSGHLINQLIPGKGPTLLQFKIDLLRASMGSKAVLLDSTDEDLMPTVELLHHVSMRDLLHTIVLEKASLDSSIAMKIFGINPLFQDNTKEQTPSIMEQLHAGGTLFIKNIHFLDMETQQYLAEYIKYGLCRVYKSDLKFPSNAHIICSSSQNLAQRVQQGTFSRSLYESLQQTKLTVPSLITLPEKELHALTEGFSEQVMHYDTFEHVLALSEKEKQRLTRVRPASLNTLKQRVQHLLVQKSKKHNIYDESTFNPAYEVSDPDLTQAKCLGRQALKDRQVMALLWEKFKNQSDIAKFLNVDRSSVWRRCKEYGLDQSP
jgi:transcriptional regulator of aromatic amino acid metabolism